MRRFSMPLLITITTLSIVTGCGGGSSSGYSVPWATITIDGNADDWPESKATVIDAAGDQEVATPGGDIIAIYLAQDEGALYLRIDVSNGPVSEQLSYFLNFSLDSSGWGPDGDMVTLDLTESRCVLSGSSQSESSPEVMGTYAISGNIIELSVPKGTFNTESTRFLTVYSSAPHSAMVDFAPEDGIPISF